MLKLGWTWKNDSVWYSWKLYNEAYIQQNRGNRKYLQKDWKKKIQIITDKIAKLTKLKEHTEN